MRSTTGEKITQGLKQIGPKTYQSRVKTTDARSGKDVERIRTHRNMPNARAALRAHEAFHAEVTKAAKSSDEWTLSEAIDSYAKSLTFGTHRTRKPHFKRFRADGRGDRRLSQIATPEWQRWFRTLTVRDETVNLYLDTLRGIYRHAWEHGRLIGDNTAAAVTRRRTRFDEAASYKRAQGPAGPGKALLGEARRLVMTYLREHHYHFHQLFQLMFLLGLRWGEAVALQWGDIDWDTGLVTIRRMSLQNKSLLTLPKTKKPRVTCLGPRGLAFMRAHRAWVQKMKWPGWELWVFPRSPIGPGKPPEPPQIFDRSEPPLPGFIFAYQHTWTVLAEALKKTEVKLVGATHALRHAHVTLTEGLTSDAIERAAQLEMTGHGEGARKTYVGKEAQTSIAQDLASRMDAVLAGGTQGGTRAKNSHELGAN